VNKLDIPALEARAEEHYRKSDEYLAEWRNYREECTILLDRIAESSGEDYLIGVALNANRYETEHLRRAQRERSRGHRYTKRAQKLREKDRVLERVLLPSFGQDLINEYTPSAPVTELWVDFKNDPSDPFAETRQRIEAPKETEEAKA
jgi:hypothetical protein